MYTQQERHEIYKELHNLINIEGYHFFLCNNLPIIKNTRPEHKNKILEKEFPEMAIMLNILKDGDYAAWTNRENNGNISPREVNERRKTILEFCMELTNPN